jgi:hypothetical protein
MYKLKYCKEKAINNFFSIAVGPVVRPAVGPATGALKKPVL